MDALFNIIGIIGTVALLAGFYLQQKGSIPAGGMQYLWLNLIGSVGIIISLLRFWNLAAFLLDFAWAIISIQGILKLRAQKA